MVVVAVLDAARALVSSPVDWRHLPDVSVYPAGGTVALDDAPVAEHAKVGVVRAEHRWVGARKALQRVCAVFGKLRIVWPPPVPRGVVARVTLPRQRRRHRNRLDVRRERRIEVEWDRVAL